MPMLDRRFNREGVAQVLAALFGGKFCLGGGRADAAAAVEIERNVQAARNRTCDLDGLVESPLAVPARMERNRHDGAGRFFQCRQFFRH